MRIIYTEHLVNRLKLRKIPYDLPREVYLSFGETFFDTQTNHFVALSEKVYFGKLRTLTLTFDKFSDRVELITIHPIAEKDKISRIQSGRWIKK